MVWATSADVRLAGVGKSLKIIKYISRIAKINKLYDDGNTIIYYTARGMFRNNGDKIKCYEQFYNLTFQQLIKWECKFHELRLGKQLYHYWIDDKAINSEVFFNEYKI